MTNVADAPGDAPGADATATKLGQRQRLLQSLKSQFVSLGDYVAHNPWKTIVFSTLLSILFGLGAGGVKLETEGVFLWIPTTSQTYKNFISYNDVYQGGAKLNFIFYIISAKNGGTVMTKNVLDQVLRVHQTTVDMELVTTAGTVETFETHCFKPTKAENGIDGACRSRNFLEFWGYNASNIPSDDVTILSQINTMNDVSPVTNTFGGLTYAEDGTVSAADTLTLAYFYRNDPDGGLVDYEMNLIEETKPEKLKTRYPNLDVQRLTSLSFDEEVKNLVVKDMPLFMGAIYVITIFLALTFGRLNASENRIFLAFVTIPMVMLSLLFATGVQGYFSSTISTLNFLIGFLLAGVGVDDMIVVEEFYKRACKEHANKTDALKHGLGEAGLAVFLTSLTAVCAFSVGSFVDLPAVRSFCVCSGLAFFWNFFLNMTFFPAFMILDERRCGCMPCCDSRAKKEERDASVENGDTRKDMEKQRREPEQAAAVVKFKPEQSEMTTMEMLFANVITPALTQSTASQVVIALVMLGASLGSFLYGLDIDIGLKVTEVVPDGSYAVDFFDTMDDKFRAQVKMTAINIRGLDYGDQGSVEKLNSLFTEVSAIDTAASSVGGVFGSWLDNYVLYLQNVEGKDRFSDFGDNWIDFLESSTCGGNSCASYALDVSGDIDEGTGRLIKVNSARFFYDDVTATATEEVWKTYKELESIRNKYSIDGYFYTEVFLFAENDSLMFEYLFRSLGVTLLAIGVIMMIFTDAVSSLYITITVICVDCHLLGLSRLWGIQLNSVMFTCMLMSVGLSVDYCVHIAHAFVHATEKSSAEGRLREALASLGPAVLKGGFTTLLGVILLSGASSSVFRMFFKLLFLTVIFGLFYGIVFLSVLLTLHMKLMNLYQKTRQMKGIEFQERKRRNLAEKDNVDVDVDNTKL